MLNRQKQMLSLQPRILGIDPGYGRIGIAVIEKFPKEKLLMSECLETDPTLSSAARLLQIFERIEAVIETWQPSVLAIEKLFFNKNITTGIKVAEARGVMIALAQKNGLSVCEYNPLEVKSATTGNGKATKDQMINMVSKLIKLEKKPKHDDEYDAIAIALTCSAIERFDAKNEIKNSLRS